MQRTLGFLLALGSFVACSASGRVPSTVDASTTEVPSDASTKAETSKAKDGGNPFLGDAQLAGKTCERSIDVGALSISNPNCFVNEHVSNRSGTLTFPCEGGKATLEIDGKTLTGTVNGDDVTLKLVEPFIFNNCQWESTETIAGDIASGTLTYEYKEKPLAACTDTPCTGSGSLKVEGGEVVVVK